METRLPSRSVSGYLLLIVGQFIVNVSLALWLYNEYLHNPFMQAYVSTMWSAIWPEVVIAVGVATVAVASVIAYNRGRPSPAAKGFGYRAMAKGIGTSANLGTIDVCPFCDLPLKTVSEGRLQCRNCRRYFKSNLPKVSA